MKPLQFCIVPQEQLHLFHVVETQVKLPKTYKKSRAQSIFPNLYLVAGIAISLLLFSELARAAGKFLAGF